LNGYKIFKESSGESGFNEVFCLSKAAYSMWRRLFSPYFWYS